MARAWAAAVVAVGGTLLAGHVGPDVTREHRAAPTATAHVVTAPSSIPSSCDGLAGPGLTAWLASLPPGTTARLRSGGCYSLDTGVTISDARDLTLDGDGARLVAVTRSVGTSRTLLSVVRGSDVTIEDLSLRGALDFTGPYTQGYRSPDEWQHGISFRGTQTASVLDVSISRVLGDFVYVGPDNPTSRDWTASTHVTVAGDTFDGAGRNGVSVTDGEYVTIRDTHLSDVNADGVDLEPGADIGLARHITVQGNTFGALRYSAVANGGSGAQGNVGDVTITGNTSAAMPATCWPFAWISAPSGVVRDRYVIADNDVLSYQTMVEMSGTADVRIADNTDRSANGDGGCRKDWGVSLDDVTLASVTGNDLASVHTAVKAVGATTVVATDNRTAQR